MGGPQGARHDVRPVLIRETVVLPAMFTISLMTDCPISSIQGTHDMNGYIGGAVMALWIGIATDICSLPLCMYIYKPDFLYFQVNLFFRLKIKRKVKTGRRWSKGIIYSSFGVLHPGHKYLPVYVYM